jgi:hypothetical protein
MDLEIHCDNSSSATCGLRALQYNGKCPRESHVINPNTVYLQHNGIKNIKVFEWYSNIMLIK